MNLLLDTNVIIDYLGRKQPFFEDAERIVAMGYFGDARLWASAQSFKDAFYVLSHFVDSQKVQHALVRLSEIVNLADLPGDDVLKAAKLGWDDMEDCLIAICAEKTGADYLITRDQKGFSRSPVPALSPSSLLEKLREEEGVLYEAVQFASEKPNPSMHE